MYVEARHVKAPVQWLGGFKNEELGVSNQVVGVKRCVVAGKCQEQWCVVGRQAKIRIAGSVLNHFASWFVSQT